MGQKDLREKLLEDYEDYEDVFSDIFNVLYLEIIELNSNI